MKNLTFTRTLTALLSLAGLAVIAGCQHQPIAHGENFYTDDQETSVGQIARAQDAAGAKNDGMLYDAHFHEGELNALGQVKLDLIVKGTPAGDPVLVYLNMPHDRVAECQSAVTVYLKSKGLPDEKIIVAEGSNANPSTPTAYNIGGVYKSDGTSYNGAAATDTGSAASGMGGAH